MRFTSEIDEAVMTNLDPKLFLSLIRYSVAYQGGIEKMERIFKGRFSDDSSFRNFNVSAGVDSLMMVPVTCYYRHYFGISLREKDITEEEVQQCMTSEETRLVDGNFRLWAILEQTNKDPEV